MSINVNYVFSDCRINKSGSHLSQHNAICQLHNFGKKAFAKKINVNIPLIIIKPHEKNVTRMKDDGSFEMKNTCCVCPQPAKTHLHTLKVILKIYTGGRI